MTSPLTGWPPPAAAAAALPSCAAAGPGTVKGPEPPLCSPTALHPPPSPSWDPKGLRGVGDGQDRAEALGAIPQGRIQSPPGPWQSPGSPSSAAAGTASAEQEGSWEHPPTPHGHQWGAGVPRDPLPAWQPALSGSQLLPSPNLPGMFSARPGLGSAAPPAPHRPPSASGSAGRPPPAGSAPCRNSLSTRHRARDMCQDHILLRDPAGRHGATASPCVAVLARSRVPNPSCLKPPCPTRCV